MTLHYTILGQGEPVVLLHGMAGSSRYWNEAVRNFSPEKYKIINLDLLGFGLSPKPTDVTYNYETHIAAIKETLDALDVKSFVLVGHSMGALLALRLAAYSDFEIRHLVLVGLPFYPSPEAARAAITNSSWLKKRAYYGNSSKLLCTVWCNYLGNLSKHVAPLYLKGVSKAVAQDSVLHTWQSYDQSLRNVIETQHVDKDLKRITVPVSILYGSADNCYPVFKKMIKASDYPNCELIVIKEAGHHLPISHPNIVLSIANP